MKGVIPVRVIARLILVIFLSLSHFPFQLVYASEEVISNSNDSESETYTFQESEEFDGSELGTEDTDDDSQSTQYIIDLRANLPMGGTAIDLSTNTSVVWGTSGTEFSNITAVPNPGYRFVEWAVVSGPARLEIPTSQTSVVTMGAGNSVVQAIFTPLQGGDIRVKHEDIKGNKLAEDQIITGLFDEEYSTEALSIDGWRVSHIPDNISNTFTQEEQVVRYQYELNEPLQNLWGTVPWSYDEENEAITLYGGEAGTVETAPWKTHTIVETISVNDSVTLPQDSSNLFEDLQQLKSIENANNFDVSNVKNMSGMFNRADALIELDVSNWDTSQVTDMGWMFAEASSLTTLDVSNWDTSKVTNMVMMFRNAISLIELDVSNWDTSQDTNTVWFFQNTPSLARITLGEKSIFSYGFTGLSISQMNDQYTGRWILECSDSMVVAFENSATFMEEYDGSHPGTYIWEKSGPLWGRVRWSYDEENETITLYGGEAGTVETAPWRTHTSVETILVNDSVRLPQNSSHLFANLQQLKSIENADKFDVSQVTDMRALFQYANSLTTLDVSEWDTSNVRNMRFMFNQAHSLKELDVGNWDTSQVTDVRTMFQNANSLTTLDVSSWNTSKVTDMGFMFNQTHSLKELDVSNWDTSQVTSMGTMFQHANSLTTLDVSSWNTSKVTNMSFMFNQAASLKELDVSNWDTSQVTDMRTMFQNANSLTTLDVSRWNTSQITDMGFMFTLMRSLKELDMSNWDTSQVTNMQSMFGGTNALNRITLGEQSIFSAATNLPAIPSNEQYTGRWTLEENLSGDGSVITFENSNAFMTEYKGSNPGTYVWEEQILANIDRISDQSETITGYVTESVDELTITYQTTDGQTVSLTKNDSRIIWGGYQNEDLQLRRFHFDLLENERLETETTVILKGSKPSSTITADALEEQIVIKGIDYRANNVTLDRFKINELSTQEELENLIIQESRAQAENVLTEADMTEDFRIIETDLTREVDEDGSYFAVLEVGNKAYQMTIGIDVTSKLEHMRVTIPTKMVFESLYNTAESNRNFESQAYEIRNQSPLAVDTYINQLAIDDPAGIVLLEEGEDPLDYAESESEEEDPTLTYDDISTPLLRLNLKTDETQIQLYEAMEEQHLVRLEERSRVPISLTGDFYGDYPQWVVDAEADQGGYYEDLLAPKYRIVLRFVPRD